MAKSRMEREREQARKREKCLGTLEIDDEHLLGVVFLVSERGHLIQQCVIAQKGAHIYRRTISRKRHGRPERGSDLASSFKKEAVCFEM